MLLSKLELGQRKTSAQSFKDVCDIVIHNKKYKHGLHPVSGTELLKSLEMVFCDVNEVTAGGIESEPIIWFKDWNFQSRPADLQGGEEARDWV